MGITEILGLLTGIAFFLFGMNLMGSGLKKVAGNKMESLLWKLSSTPIKGFLLGTAVAAVIQSSAATSLMVVSFVNAGMMRFSQGVCIILGSTVGTTMTGWILTLSASSGSGIVGELLSTATLIAVLALVGIIFYMFLKKDLMKNIGLILLGLSTLLLSMSLISSAVGPLKTSEKFRSLMVMFENPVLGVLVGILVAVIIQSSSASVGILQALCVTGAIPYSLCLPVILGVNIGASTPVLLSMIGANKNSKRASLSYFLSTILGLVIVYIIYIPASLIFDMSFMNGASTVMGIAILNTVIRLLGSFVLLPLHKVLEKLAYIVFPETEAERVDERELDGLKDSLLAFPSAALTQAENATIRMAVLTYQNVERALDLFDVFSDEDLETVNTKEALIDKYEDKLGNFVIKISKNGLSIVEQRKIAQLLNVISDFERIADHAVNIAETAKEKYDKKIVFSASAENEMNQLIKATHEILHMTMTAFTRQLPELATDVDPLEELIDDMTKIMRSRHIDRLQQNECTILTGFVFNDMITNVERISDHCSNVAFVLCHNSKLTTEAHQYAENLADSVNFKNKYNEFKEKFVI